MMERRHFIKGLGASLLVMQSPSFAAKALLEKTTTNPKVIWLVLRGAMDSLHTIVPTFESELPKLRPKLSTNIKDQLLMLDNGYGLHPSLINLHQWYQQKQLLPIVAVGSGYDQRSHFDGQDYLESGLKQVDHDSGWLGRLVNVQEKQALAIARSTPISLRGESSVNTWYPSKLKEADDDIYQALMNMYQDDALLTERLRSGLEVKEMTMDKSSKKQQGKFNDLAKACAQLMSGEQGADCAMLELGGWDTHNNQEKRLARQLATLDQGLATIKTGLGKDWNNTLVVVATEFGRTAKENGTGGTDHGTGSAMFLAGGAVNGGQVLGEWPGLSQQQLFEQRDLMPTTNTFSWIAAAMSQHWQLSAKQLDTVFPQVSLAKAKLIRTS